MHHYSKQTISLPYTKGFNVRNLFPIFASFILETLFHQRNIEFQLINMKDYEILKDYDFRIKELVTHENIRENPPYLTLFFTIAKL